MILGESYGRVKYTMPRLFGTRGNGWGEMIKDLIDETFD